MKNGDNYQDFFTKITEVKPNRNRNRNRTETVVFNIIKTGTEPKPDISNIIKTETEPKPNFLILRKPKPNRYRTIVKYKTGRFLI